jgi:nucleotide-binding universal stress UspA family protein
VRGGIRGPIIYDWEDDEVKKILDGATAHAKKAGTSRVEEITLSGRDASAVIVQYAEANGFDHIVVGTGDKHGISRLVLGSVAAGISAGAHCSVTIAR